MSLFQVTKKQVIENYELRTMTGDIVSFTPSYSQLLPDPFSDLNVTVNVLATGGNGTPDNPNPIVGYSSANITRCGVNLFDKTQLVEGKFYNIVNNVIVEQSNANKAHLPLLKVKPSTTYYMSGFAGNSYYTIIALDADKNPITYYGGASKTEPFIATLPNNCEFVYLNINIELADTTIFCESNEIIPYTPYNGQTYAIAFGQTVYGGVLDVTRGKLTVDYVKLLVDENTTLYSTSNSSYANIFYDGPFMSNNYGVGISDQYKFDTWANTNGDVADAFTIYKNPSWVGETRLAFNRNGLTHAEFVANLENNPITVVYKLETPFDIDLTPVQIEALLGVNNVFADCGETTVTCLI